MEDRFEPADIVVKRDEGVTITFADGYIGSFSLLDLRTGCPCAACRHQRDQGRPSWSEGAGQQPLGLADANLHGAWGLHLTWNDGHSTGIFPFDALRRWSEGQPIADPNAGLGHADV